MASYLYFIIVAASSAAVSAILTPVIIRLAGRFRLFDCPCERKVHTREVSRLGGIGLFAGFTIGFGMLVALVLTGKIETNLSPQLVFTFYLGTILFFLLGLMDDFFELGARFKFVMMILFAVVLALLGIQIGTLFGTVYLPVWAALSFTAFWIVGLANAMNFIDGLDGLSAGVGLLACIAFLVIAIARGEYVIALILACMIGALAGFLPYNFFPAKIFIGDSGALFLGFFLAAISVIGLYKQITIVTLALPVMVLALPITDTIFAITRRIFRRIPITRPDRKHIHHRLLMLFGRNSVTENIFEGPAHRSAVLACYFIAFVFATVAVFLGVK
jgi:UDP-GlcNAc:undecaprenyl-phosphate/decaprenyl-phosphate GlcNAc-1-phosphate transferase